MKIQKGTLVIAPGGDRCGLRDDYVLGIVLQETEDDSHVFAIGLGKDYPSPIYAKEEELFPLAQAYGAVRDPEVALRDHALQIIKRFAIYLARLNDRQRQGLVR